MGVFGSNKIRLFWWNEKILMGKTKENYGDVLGKYLVEKISGKEAVWVHPKKWHFRDLFLPVYVTVGSILAQVNKKCVVWGSGIISKDIHVKEAEFLAVRGPQTRDFLLQKGYSVPEIYGDPALLLPQYYNPKIQKQYRVGIIPHYNDFKATVEAYKNKKGYLVIDLMTESVETTTNEILSCERIVSSSLHGVIVGHAYGIPTVWVPFSNKLFGDGIKFQDYFESVGIPFYTPKIHTDALELSAIEVLFNTYPSLPDAVILKQLQKGLLEVCPFHAQQL